MRAQEFESLVYSCTSEIDTRGIDVVVGGKGTTINVDSEKFKRLVHESIESAKKTDADRIVFSYRNGNLSVSADTGPVPEIRRIFVNDEEVDEYDDIDPSQIIDEVEVSNDSFHYRIKSADDLLS